MARTLIVSDRQNSFFTANNIKVGVQRPTEGTYSKGDIVVNIGENTANEAMWICVEAGTPGVWEVVGAGAGGGGSLVAINESITVNEPVTEVSLGNLIGKISNNDKLLVHYNSTHLMEGVDYEVNAEGTRIVKLTEGSWNESGEDGALFAFELLKNVESVNGNEIVVDTKLTSIVNNMVVSAPTTEVEIGVEGFNKDNDTLLVFKNGVIMVEGVEYNISEDSTKITSINEVWNESNVEDYGITFVVFKEVVIYDGENGSITLDMLGKDVRDTINGLITITETNATNIYKNTEAISKIDLSGYATKEDLENVEVDLSPYQEKNSDSLITTSKEIVGAINEVENETIDIKNSLVSVLLNKGISCNTDQSWFELFGLLVNNISSGGGEDTGGGDNGELNIGQWNTLKSLGLGRSVMGVCAYEGKIYCLGGLTNSGVASNMFNSYDPSTDTWETLSFLSANIFGASCIGINGKIHVFSQMQTPNSNACTFCHYYYDIASDSWSSDGDPQTSTSKLMPCAAFNDDVTGRIHLLVWNDDTIIGLKVYTAHNGFDYIYDNNSSAPVLYLGSANCYYDGKIYSIGGYLGDSSNAVMQSTAYSYDTETSVVTTLTRIPVDIAGACAEVYNGKIYVFGGFYRDGSTTIYQNDDMYIYDIAGNTWTKIGDVGINRAYAGSCIIDNKIYAIGGKAKTDATNIFIPEVQLTSTANEVFVIGDENNEDDDITEPTSGTYYNVATLGTPRKGMAVEAAGDKMYIIGGLNSSGDPTNLCHSYDPAEDKWTALASNTVTTGFTGSVVYGNDNNFIATLGSDSTSTTYAYNRAYDIVNDSWGSSDNASIYESAIQDPYMGYCQNTKNVWSVVKTTTANYTFYSLTNNNTSLSFTDGDTLSNAGIYYHSAYCDNGSHLFLIGGQSNNSTVTTSTITNEFYKLDMGDYLYPTQLANCPYKITGATAELCGDSIFVIGGYILNNDGAIELNTKTFVYTISSDTWTTMDVGLITPRAHCRSCLIGDRIYVVGGTTSITSPLSGIGVVGNIEGFIIPDSGTVMPIEG